MTPRTYYQRRRLKFWRMPGWRFGFGVIPSPLAADGPRLDVLLWGGPFLLRWQLR